MKLTLISFALLFIATNSMQRIYKNSMTTLNTGSSSSYFYMYASDFYYGYVYLYFKDSSYRLNSVKVCYTNQSPDSAIQSCDFWTQYSYESTTKSSYDEYFYKFSNKDSYSSLKTYIIVNYQGSYSYGSISVEASDDDLYKTVEEIVDTVLSTVAIVFIVIGSIIGLAIIITVIVFVIMCTRRKTIQGSAGYIQPPSIVVTNPVTYPTYPVAQTPNYQYAKPV